MSKIFEELDNRETPIGTISLRRRRMMSLGDIDVFEVKLGEEFLMSSLFYEAEVALSDLGLAEVSFPELDVVVGGLGLGYTAVAALKNKTVRSLCVVEALEAVIEWHQKSLVPLGAELTNDPRCRLIQGDFFKLSDSDSGFDTQNPNRKFHAILLDVDHAPTNVLHTHHASFYEVDGLRHLSRHLHPQGVFGLWSNDPPDDGFMQKLKQVFVKCEAHVVNFDNPLQGGESSNTVYVAVKE